MKLASRLALAVALAAVIGSALTAQGVAPPEEAVVHR